MTVHWIVSKDRSWYLNGELLIYRYKAGDIDVVNGRTPKDKLYSALYDHTQVFDGFKDGDIIALPNGRHFARMESYHLVRL